MEKHAVLETVAPKELENAGIEFSHILTAVHGVEGMLEHFRKALGHLGVPVGPQGVNLDDLVGAKAIKDAAEEWHDAIILKMRG